MRDMVEIYVVLHQQKNGLTTITARPGIVGKIDLPTNLLEFSAAPEKGESYILLRLPRFIALEYGLSRSTGELIDRMAQELANQVSRSIVSEGPNQQTIEKPAARRLLAPTRSGSTGHVLDSGRAKSIPEQLAEASQDL